MFSDQEIQERWLDSVLDDSSRLKRLNTLERMPDQIFSLFGKIDEGILSIIIRIIFLYLYVIIYIYIYIYHNIYIIVFFEES